MACLAEIQYKLQHAAFYHGINEYLHSVAQKEIKFEFLTNNASSRMPEIENVK